MKASELAKAMADAGAPMEAILIALRAIEERDDAIEAKRAVERDRTKEYRKRRNLSDNEWAALTRMVVERDGWVCTYCDCDTSLPENGYAIDHVYPLAKGGSNDIDNLTMACRSCNSSKGDKILDDEWTRPNDQLTAWIKGHEK